MDDLEHDGEPWADYRWGDADVALWRVRSDRVWSAYEMGVRDARILEDLLDPDEARRFELAHNLFKAATTGDEEAQWLFGRIAVAGLCNPEDLTQLGYDPDEAATEGVEIGWMMLRSAADSGWAPAEALVSRYEDDADTD